MAGIGFELKKLFGKTYIYSKVRGVIHSVFSTIGHLLIIVALLVFIHVMLKRTGISWEYKELFSCAVLYAFVFPLIFTSGLNMLMSRYLADNLYMGNNEKVLPSMFGGLAVILLFSSVVGAIFYVISPIPFWFKFFAYILYIEMCIVFFLMIYVSAIKNYKSISISFFTGITISGILVYFIMQKDMSDLTRVTLLLLAMDIGMFIVMTGIIITIRNHFKIVSRNYFDFLKYLRKFPNLFLCNLFYTLGLYAHNFVFWVYPQTSLFLRRTYLYSPDYDMATFVGMLTILPATVFFVVRMETSFYGYYKKYIETISGGTAKDIEIARNEMKRVLWQEFIYVLEVQLILSLLLIVIGMKLLPLLGLSALTIECFPFLACGYYFTFLMFITTTVLLYFENQKDARKICFFFMITNMLFTLISVIMGSQYYAIGFVFSGFVSFIAAIKLLSDTVNRIDYIVFCNQLIRPKVYNSRFERFIDWLNNSKEKTANKTEYLN